MNENNNNLDALLRTNDQTTVSSKSSKIYNATQQKIKGICKDLTKESKSYDPIITVKMIQNYLDDKDKIDRILYSEISSYIFSLDMTARGVFATNVEKLLLYALDSDKVSLDCRKIVIKIYDHFQLALKQIENVKSILGVSLEETKINLKNEIKGMEKEYISILGIFAAIVLAFVGGITFSSSVLQNIDSVSIYRLLIVVLLIAFILVNVIWLLVRFISEINDKNIKLFNITLFNGACMVMMILVVLAWVFNIHEVAKYLYHILPWCI